MRTSIMNDFYLLWVLPRKVYWIYNDQMPPRTADVEDRDKERRASANRLAQRKFRRQHKEYVTQLERELAIARSGNGTQQQRRLLREIQLLRNQQLQLRNLLDYVVTSLRNITEAELVLNDGGADDLQDPFRVAHTIPISPGSDDINHSASDDQTALPSPLDSEDLIMAVLSCKCPMVPNERPYDLSQRNFLTELQLSHQRRTQTDGTAIPSDQNSANVPDGATAVLPDRIEAMTATSGAIRGERRISHGEHAFPSSAKAWIS